MNKTVSFVIISLIFIIVGGYLFITLENQEKVDKTPQEITDVKTPTIKVLENHPIKNSLNEG